MAKKTAVVVRRAPMVSKAKLELVKSHASNAKRKAREVGARRVGTLVGAGTCAAVGWAEKNAKLAPNYTSPMVLGLTGAVLAFVLPETGMGKGKLGQASAEAGAGLLGVAAYKIAAGQAVIGDDGDWQNG
jgi:hypothetical protein